MPRLCCLLPALLLAILVAAPPALRGDEVEDKAVQFIQGLGGKVDRATFDGPITLVVLKGTRAGDGDLKPLAVLKALRVLSLDGTAVTDAGLKELAALKQLHELDLTGTKVAGAGLKALAPLEELRTLNLTDTKVNDAGLKGLASLKGLE